MGNALFVNWSDTQTSQYFTLETSSMAFSNAIGVILTHYAVSGKQIDIDSHWFITSPAPPMAIGKLIFCIELIQNM